MLVAIGDIHGQYHKLCQLMTKLAEKTDFANDTLIFLGDYVDGGHQTKEVVEELMLYQQKYPHWVFLKGNHEDMMLDALRHGSERYKSFYQWWNQGGAETAISYGNIAAIPSEHLDWLDFRPTGYETKNFYFVHAGAKPGHKPMYTSYLDVLWIRDEFIQSDYDWGKIIVFGHTYVPEPLVMKNKIGIDTMRHGNGKITAVLLDDNRPDWYEFVQNA